MKRVKGKRLKGYFIQNLRYYARRVRGRPMRFLLCKAVDSFLREIRYFAEKVGFSPYAVHKVVYVHPKALLDIPHEWILGGASQQPGACRVIEEAKAILAHEFQFLGSGRTYLGFHIDWFKDFESGLSWPFRHHTQYSYLELIDLDRPSDIKIPWELNRLQFLPTLALAYLYTHEDRYAQELVRLIEDWDQKNPIGWGIGWSSTMEASLRGISLIWVIELMRGTKKGFDIMDARVLRILTEHGKFIYKNIEYSDINNNHHTACLLGLLYLGLFLKEVKEAHKWIKCATKGVKREVLLQTYPDGVCHEGSIPYHRLVTEMFLHAGLLCCKNEIDLGRNFWDRLEKMLEFVMAYTKPNGLAPLLGDADDGRVISLGSQDINDHRYLLSIGAAVFQRADMKAASGRLWEDAMWLLGREGIEQLESLPDVKLTDCARNFSNGGFFFLRNGCGDYVAIDCGDVGLRGRGGHGHNDALSIEICLGGQDIITDSGCFTYTASRELRRYVLSARAHNVAIVDAKEPAPIDERRFAYPTKCPTCVREWKVNEHFVIFEGEHYGYQRLSPSTTYRRRVQLSKTMSKVRLIDSFLGEGPHHIMWHFHLAAGLENVALEGPNQAIIRLDEGPISVFQWLTPLLSAKLERSDYYPSYGVCRERYCIVLEGNLQFPCKVAFEVVRIDDAQSTGGGYVHS